LKASKNQITQTKQSMGNSMEHEVTWVTLHHHRSKGHVSTICIRTCIRTGDQNQNDYGNFQIAKPQNANGNAARFVFLSRGKRLWQTCPETILRSGEILRHFIDLPWLSLHQQCSQPRPSSPW
jgi:hypothetical protein